MHIRTRFGPLKIRGVLLSRGITDHQIGEVLPDEQETWFDSASLWASKRNQGELDYAGRAKIYRSLVNRGFTHEQANIAIDNLKSGD